MHETRHGLDKGIGTDEADTFTEGRMESGNKERHAYDRLTDAVDTRIVVPGHATTDESRDSADNTAACLSHTSHE
jgi:hypothetical protein